MKIKNNMTMQKFSTQPTFSDRSSISVHRASRWSALIVTLLCVICLHPSALAQPYDAAQCRENRVALQQGVRQRAELRRQHFASPASALVAPRRTPAPCGHDDDENYYMYYETGEEAYEDVTIYYPVRPYLYPTESDDPFYFEYEDAEKIANYPNYASVKTWVALREGFRARFQPIMDAVEEGHRKGTLGPGEEDWRAIAHYNRFWEEVREAYFRFDDEFSAEFEKRENTYFTYPQPFVGVSLRDGDLSTKWKMTSTLEGQDYQDLFIAGHRDLTVEGYALTISNVGEDDLNFPRHWVLYGAYLDAEEVTDADFDVSQMTLLDEQPDFRFYYLDEMRVDFVVSHPGTYNRFVLRVFNHRDDLCYDNPITISELEFHEDEFEPTPVIDYGPEPDIAPFQVLENSVKGFDNAFLRIGCSELAADGPFYLLGKGKIEAIFRSVDPDRPEVIYDDTMSNPALEFDAEGNLTVPLVVKYGFGLFNVEYGLPKIPGHICDVIVRFRAVERATGRIVDVEEVVPSGCLVGRDA